MALRIFTEPQQGASYERLLAVARTAEECGFDAFFRSDHYLTIGSPIGLPGYTDAWITLAGMARETTRIRLGTLVSPVTFRHPGTLVVIATEVDQMSGGRVEVGIGAGWFEDEHKAYGLPFPPVGERYDLLEDQLEILHGVWSAPHGATFELTGRTCAVSLDPDSLRPIQRPHPPIVMGGAGGPRGGRLTASYADEYNVAFADVAATRRTHDKVRQACEQHGRDPSTVTWSAAQVVCCGRTDAELARRAAAIGQSVDDLRESGFAGSPDEILEKIGRFAKQGVERFYLQVLDLSDLDHLRLLAETVLLHAPGR